MKINDKIVCTVTGLQSYGVFVKCGEYTGLIHISEMSDFYIADIADICNLGDLIDATVISVDEENKRLKLSYKMANPVHPKIKKQVKIRIGFQSLARSLPDWIKEAKEKEE